MEITSKELKAWSDDLKPIIFDINVAVSNLFILKHKNSIDFKTNHQEVYLNLWYQQYFISIVQLAKIFSISRYQKRSIEKLCIRYENDDLDKELKDMLLLNKSKLTDVWRSQNDIKLAVEKIKQEMESSSIIIKKVTDLRNKVFAHTDPDSPEDNISVEELITLKDLANRIYNDLFGKIFDEYFNFSLTRQHDLRTVIEAFIR